MGSRRTQSRRDSARARRLETLGVVMIAALIFLITLARFARTIHWSVR